MPSPLLPYSFSLLPYSLSSPSPLIPLLFTPLRSITCCSPCLNKHGSLLLASYRIGIFWRFCFSSQVAVWNNPNTICGVRVSSGKEILTKHASTRGLRKAGLVKAWGGGVFPGGRRRLCKAQEHMAHSEPQVILWGLRVEWLWGRGTDKKVEQRRQWSHHELSLSITFGCKDGRQKEDQCNVRGLA